VDALSGNRGPRALSHFLGESAFKRVAGNAVSKDVSLDAATQHDTNDSTDDAVEECACESAGFDAGWDAGFDAGWEGGKNFGIIAAAYQFWYDAGGAQA